MKSINQRKEISSVFVIILFLNMLLAGCKKDSPIEPVEKKDTVVTPVTPPIAGKVETPLDIAPATGTRDQLTQDSIFIYARQIYLWWDKIPGYQQFNPRQAQYAEFDKEIYAITRFGIDPKTNKPYEFSATASGTDSQEPKYSYYTDATQKNPVAYISNKKSSVDLEGNGFDYGLLVRPYGTETSYKLYVQAVYPSSPAAKAGFKRGDQLTKIDDRALGTNYNAEINYWYNSLFNSSTVKIQGTSSAGASFTRGLNKASYQSSPMYKDSVYTYNPGAKKIGYMAYGRFSNGNNSDSEFARVFNRFSQAGVTDLIVDLRYNGGGYVSTAETLINYIAPNTLNGKVMFTEYYNELMQAKKATILAKQPLLDSYDRPQYHGGKLVTYANVDYSVAANTNHFSKKGSLNSIKNVVFIVTESTASASELVINSLKPHLNVKIVGSTSYGKPVGFFPVRIDKYDVYFSMFETRNSKNEGGYFAGFTPDTQSSTADNDNPNFDFGDLKEASFLAAYNYLTKGSFTADAGTATISSKRPEPLVSRTSSATNLEDREFKGMIQAPNKLKLLKK